MISIVKDGSLWPPTTSGERLLFMLLSNHTDWRVLSEKLQTSSVGMGRRCEDLIDFFVGASALHLLQRLIRLGYDIRTSHAFDRERQLHVLRSRLRDGMGIVPSSFNGDFDAFLGEIIESAEQTTKEIPKVLKKRINSRASCCYSCGRIFGSLQDDAPNGLQATADHIWPQSLGGDSIEENLLSSCESCNSRKGHIAVWQMAWIQPVVISDHDEAGGIASIGVEVKMALHARAAVMYAQRNRTTLKNSYLTIGPREPISRVSDDDGLDFFSIRVHDEKRTRVSWRPK